MCEYKVGELEKRKYGELCKYEFAEFDKGWAVLSLYRSKSPLSVSGDFGKH